MQRAEALKLQITPAKARNQKSTDKSTCTTSAEWKKSTQGKMSCTYGGRDSTSSTANRPAPTSDAMPSQSQPEASRRLVAGGDGGMNAPARGWAAPAAAALGGVLFISR